MILVINMILRAIGYVQGVFDKIVTLQKFNEYFSDIYDFFI